MPFNFVIKFGTHISNQSYFILEVVMANVWSLLLRICNKIITPKIHNKYSENVKTFKYQETSLSVSSMCSLYHAVPTVLNSELHTDQHDSLLFQSLCFAVPSTDSSFPTLWNRYRPLPTSVPAWPLILPGPTPISTHIRNWLPFQLLHHLQQVAELSLT